ncbi:hypothetical protein F9U44_07825 [Pectobacterium versatile]|uniref:hypothetical protein n=1 Tax=Pectobacterium versatile TaxID=2488639 RepID=UPI001B3A4ED0|nr:hypothetical protein [Pectobacterium versatile]MBQ4771400.1 hypothetical protein [Pectobacterium versatile]
MSSGFFANMSAFLAAIGQTQQQPTHSSQNTKKTTLHVSAASARPKVVVEVVAKKPGRGSDNPVRYDTEPHTERAASQLPAELAVFLPFRKYTLILRHQILSNLGKVSHFVLQALATDGFGIDDVLRITGLSNEHLSPILERLAGLDWYEPASRTLTPKGKIMAQAATLAGQKFSLWIDGYDPYSSSQFVLGDEALLPKEAVSAKTVLPEFESDWNILSVLQQQRLTRRLSAGKNSQGELLPLLKQLCDVAFHDVIDQQDKAWDFRLEIDRSVKSCSYLELTLPKGLPLGEIKSKSLSLYAPIVNYRLNYSLSPWLGNDISLPVPQSQAFCLLTGESLDAAGPSDATSSWPLEAMLARTELLTKIRAFSPAVDPLIGQEVSLTPATRKLALSFGMIAEELAKNVALLSETEQ